MKKLMAILLAAVQLLCLCACGNGEVPSTTAPGAEPIGTTSVSTGETTEPENGIDHTTTDVYQLDKWFKNVPTAKSEFVSVCLDASASNAGVQLLGPDNG